MQNALEVRHTLAQRLQASLGAAGTTADTLSVPALLKSCEAIGPKDHYKHFPAPFQSLAAEIRRLRGESGLRLALHASVLQGAVDTLGSPRFDALPARVKAHQLRQYVRIAEQCAPDAEWLAPGNDLFQKDFGLATLRLYAGAAQLIDPRCGIARSILMADGVGGLPHATAALRRLGGFSPYFQIHTHTAYLDEFNEEGWNECYRVCADLYAIHPDALGMYGASWFYDPQLESISPRLVYLSKVPLDGGAERLLAARQGEFVDDAIATSPTRRKLHEEGKYQPCSYLLAWGRQAQTKWAAEHPGGNAATA